MLKPKDIKNLAERDLVDWEDFKREFKEAGNTIEAKPEDGEIILLYRRYRILDIKIINGRARIQIIPFAFRYEKSRMITTFILSFDVTELNLDHLKKSQKDKDFRYEVTPKMEPNFLIGKYSIQVGDKRLRFR